MLSPSGAGVRLGAEMKKRMMVENIEVRKFTTFKRAFENYLAEVREATRDGIQQNTGRQAVGRRYNRPLCQEISWMLAMPPESHGSRYAVYLF
jgi:hypothetical protein